MVNYGGVPPIYGGNTGTIDLSKFGRTGGTSTNPDFFRLYTEQLYVQNLDILFGEEGVNNSVFGDTGTFGTAASSTSNLFGEFGGVTLPSDISGLTQQTGGAPYIELLARSNLPGKTVVAVNPLTKQKFTGEVKSVLIENGMILINVDGIKIPPENILEIKI